jgi:hypothetical protein
MPMTIFDSRPEPTASRAVDVFAIKMHATVTEQVRCPDWEFGISELRS